jgi:hypothetical protein
MSRSGHVIAKPILHSSPKLKLANGDTAGAGVFSVSKMAGVAGLEPVTSAVTGQRSNQLSYTPAMGTLKLEKSFGSVKFCFGI